MFPPCQPATCGSPRTVYGVLVVRHPHVPLRLGVSLTPLADRVGELEAHHTRLKASADDACERIRDQFHRLRRALAEREQHLQRQVREWERERSAQFEAATSRVRSGIAGLDQARRTCQVAAEKRARKSAADASQDVMQAVADMSLALERAQALAASDAEALGVTPARGIAFAAPAGADLVARLRQLGSVQELE